MKRVVLLLALFLPTLMGCNGTAEKTAQSPAAPKEAAAPTAAGPEQGFSGTVLQTMNAGAYTYAQIQTDKGELWAAAPKMALKEGDEVLAPAGMLMKNFHSKALERDFEELFFVDTLAKAGDSLPPAASAMPAGHPQVPGQAGEALPSGHPTIEKVAPMEIPAIEKAAGGYTVAEIFARKDELAGKKVTIRGLVGKFNPKIMGTNWLHLVDGSGQEGTNDLTVTSNDTVKPGTVVTATGVLAIDKDFGYGYSYPVILQEATLAQ